MAFTTDIRRFEHGIAARIHGAIEALRAQRARQAAFRQTYDELAALSDRELADLGIARSDIADIAREAAREV